jgi:PAS domain S-box-containing protein
MEHVADALFVYDPEGRIFDVNRRACGTLGYTREELLSLSMTDLETILLPGGVVGLWLRLALDEPVSAEGSQRRKDGSTSPVEVRAGLLEANGRRLALSVARDISERKALTEQLSYRAFRDPLTGLHNRTLFMDRLERALMRADRKGNAVAILFLDLDDFKVINDSLGHDTGDQILLEVGRRRVRRPARRRWRRRGGSPGGREDKSYARSLIRAWGHKLRVTASIGVAIGVSPGDGSRGLLRDADLAMYAAKEKGKNRCEIYHPGTSARG